MNPHLDVPQPNQKINLKDLPSVELAAYIENHKTDIYDEVIDMHNQRIENHEGFSTLSTALKSYLTNHGLHPEGEDSEIYFTLIGQLPAYQRQKMEEDKAENFGKKVDLKPDREPTEAELRRMDRNADAIVPQKESEVQTELDL